MELCLMLKTASVILVTCWSLVAVSQEAPANPDIQAHIPHSWWEGVWCLCSFCSSSWRQNVGSNDRSRLTAALPKWQINDPMDQWRQAPWWNLHWFVVCKAEDTLPFCLLLLWEYNQKLHIQVFAEFIITQFFWRSFNGLNLQLVSYPLLFKYWLN